ncbi:MAG: hypothetical protein NZL83_02480 [Candidatus Absconditabacterales bacterium]|nr:hypothetical protein [Candidatus Absconditabacterales bacterium]
MIFIHPFAMALYRCKNVSLQLIIPFGDTLHSTLIEVWMIFFDALDIMVDWMVRHHIDNILIICAFDLCSQRRFVWVEKYPTDHYHEDRGVSVGDQGCDRRGRWVD